MEEELDVSELPIIEEVTFVLVFPLSLVTSVGGYQ